ncbi:MAG: LytR/AlgR family response regulator transcription factor [Bacteroidota bacterium]
MKVTCIAVDDEPLALDILEDYINKVPFLSLEKTFTNPMDAMSHFQNFKTDLIFLDIQMEEITGIQFLQVLKEKPDVILTTAYENYALKGYELEVTDYLLKPISFERFVQAVNKVYERKFQRLGLAKPAGENTMTISNEASNYFFVKTESRLQKVDFSDILYIEGQGDYLRIICIKEKIMTLQNFKRMEEILPDDNFIRVHKSYIVALNKIDSIERNRIKIGAKYIPISETYKKTFHLALERKGLL